MNNRFEGGLWCHEVLALLDRYIDDHLEPAELEQVTAHVGECTACAEFGGAYARVVHALRAGPGDALDAARLARLHTHLADSP